MPNLPSLSTTFKTLREVDVSALRDQAEGPFHVAVTGDVGVGKSTLIAQMLTGPREADPPGIRPITEHRLDVRTPVESHTVVLLVLDASQPEHRRENEYLGTLAPSDVPLVVCYNKTDLAQNRQAVLNEALHWGKAQVTTAVATDRSSLGHGLIPAMMRACKGREVLLARNLPLFREAVAKKLIDDACFVNAAYSLATGLAEMNVIVDVPLNVADIVVLTKNQALLAFKIALALGLPSDWRQTIPKLATVVGGAFLWRQVARQLVGLIPAYGIIPKVAVSYAGTYVVGQAVYQWCANGEKLSPAAARQMYARSLERGRQVARTLLERRKRARLGSPARPPE